MSLVNCIQKANKVKRVFSSAEVQELTALAAENRKTMEGTEAERAAVQALLDEALAEQAEVAALIREAAPAVAAPKPAPAPAQTPAAAPAGEVAAVEPVAEKPAKQPAAKIDDFGQKLEGARKDYATTLKDAEDVDVSAEPLSKSWPEPDYQKLLDGGADPFVVAFIHAARDEVPTKPQKAWKLKGWVDSVQTLRGAARGLLDGSISRAQLDSKLTLRAFDNVRRNVGSRAELYQLVGHEKSLKGITFAEHQYTLYKGRSNVRKWVVEQKAKATMFSNWPRELAVADTKEEMLEQFRARFAEPNATGKNAPAKGKFSVYTKRKQEGVFIGKKIGREYIDLKKLPDIASARKFLDENTAELETLLEKYKETPFERNPENQPRVGDDHRNGAPVTPKIFEDTFGFRGVQFGNYVEQARRQSDLNQGFDSLMDLAAVLGVPPRALSLNGRLGLAFGARGKGGTNAPAAHYESGNVVINLTKNAGPGSLAHEWWHAVDNYFGKNDGGAAYGTGGTLTDKTRAAMRLAFNEVKSATQQGTLRRRAMELDKRKSKPYWDTPIELSARSFESYVIAKLKDQGAANDYLANVVSKEFWDAQEALRAGVLAEGKPAETYPYPTPDEVPAVRNAFDNFFRVVETRTDDAGNVALFSRAPGTQTEIGEDDDSGRSVGRVLPRGLDEGAARGTGRGTGEGGAAAGILGNARTGGRDLRAGGRANRGMEVDGSVFQREANLSRTPGARAGVPMADAEAVADAIRAAYPTGPQIVVLDDVRKAPEALLDQIRAVQAANTVEGAYYKGKIYLFPQNVSDIARLMFVGAHHEIRHAGLDALFGKRKGALLLSIAMSNPKVAAAARQKMADGLADSMVAATEEALADMPLEDMAKLNGWNKIVAAVRQWLRDMAARLKRNHPKLAAMIEPDQWTDNDVAALIRRAEDISRGGTVPARPGGAVFSDQDSQDWYSALAEQTGKASMNAGPASAWKALVKNWTTTGKVKADEVEWSGLNEWLDMQPGKITKAQVAEYLRANGVQVTETVFSDEEAKRLPPGWRVELSEDPMGDDTGWAVIDDQGEERGFGETPNEAIENAQDGDALGDTPAATKYANYTLPGGTNYREVLLTLPMKAATVDTAGWTVKLKRAVSPVTRKPEYEVFNAAGESQGTSYSETTEEAAIRNVARTLAQRGTERANYKSGHWDQPNIVAHIRVNDRTDADGARVLFVEEIQSDWAQEGKKKGFAQPAWTIKVNGVLVPSAIYGTKAEADAAAKAASASGLPVSVVETSTGIVPRAPLIDKTDKWVALAMKRVIKMAVDGGYDRVAFVTGEQSADRYDLSKQISTVRLVTDDKAGTLRGALFNAVQISDGRAINQTINSPADLENVIGKELAERLLNTEPTKGKGGNAGAWVREISGLDLKMGGEGMRAFYDKIVPAVAKDVLRKLGGGALETVNLSHRNQKGYFETVGEVDENGVPVDENPQARFVPYDDVALTQPGFTITQAMRDKARGGMPLFSRATQTPASGEPARFSRAGTAKTTAQDLLNSNGGVFGRAGDTRQDRVRAVVDGSRPFWLGALTRDQIADMYGDELPPVRDYDNLTRAMENERQGAAQKADELYEEWSKIDAEANDRLARVMLDATVAQVHPDRETLPATATEEQKQAHGRLRVQFKLLPKDAQAMYGKVRDFHANTLKDLRAALEGRIERLIDNGSERAVALADIRARFDKYMQGGPYFPLHRFGDFLVVAERAKDGERVVAAYENAGEQQAAARALEADGFAVKLTMAKAYSRSMDGSAGKFIGDVLAAIDKMDMREASINGSATSMKAQLLDDLNQLFIKALPDLSYRKHFTHRKGTAGFSADVMRGFASSAFHAAGHIARLNHGDKMTFALEDAYQQIKLAPEGDFTRAGQVLNEMSLRHESALNPNVSPLSALATQVGFVMYLGLSPAAGLINMMQVPMVALPYIGARYGFAKATAAMGRAYTDIMGAKPNAKNGFNAAQSPKLSADERRAISTLQDEGVIDLTQAHDLATATTRDVGNQARNKASFAIARAMRIVGWTFHVPEVMNRQVTALMAYRLEMAKSGDEGKAMDAAREAIKRSQFDYSSSNRARFMQGDIARVVTQFRQFSQNMTYFLGRAAYQALKGEDPEVRRIARQQLVATFLVTGAMAGSLGLPGLGFFAGLVQALVNAMGDDDDEPWDWKVAYRNALADNFGKEWGEVMARGVPRALMPAWDISNRVSLGDLWWRDSGRDSDSPREAYANDLGNILGPTAGTLLGWYTASDHMARGDYAKAVESVVPKFIRDPLKAWRESQDGVTSYNGEQLLELTGAEVAGRFLGFAPSRASEMYEGRSAVMGIKTALEDRRERLIAKMAKARIDGDTEVVAEMQQRIRDWNTENPKMAITGATIVRSVLNRRRNTANTEKGITLPDSKDFLRDRARFAEVD